MCDEADERLTAGYIAKLRKDFNDALSRENVLYNVYHSLRRELESLGPVPPISRIMLQHYQMMEQRGYADPLRHDAP